MAQNTKYKITHELISKLQNLKGKSKMKAYKNINKYYDEMNYSWQKGYFQFEETTFSKGAHGIAKNMHEASLILKF